MKKLILLFILLFISKFTYSQNAIGDSWSDVMKMLNDEGYIVNYGMTESKTKYITGVDDGKIRIYYFTDNNMCFCYVLIVENSTQEVYRQSLLESGYSFVGGKYYKQIYEAEIMWLDNVKSYAIKFLFNNPDAKYNRTY